MEKLVTKKNDYKNFKIITNRMANYPNSNARKKFKLLAIGFKLPFNSKLTNSNKI
ncbi:hypothetical protein Kazakh3193_14770 [Helicobacter pylori]